MKRIPCFVFIYENHELIKQSLNSILKEKRIDYYIIENKSKNSAIIQESILTHLKNNEIKGYLQTEENITNNALELAFDFFNEAIESADYLMITDGDLTVKDPNWLTEELQILENHPNVFACGIQLSTENLPLKTCPDAIGWLPEKLAIHPDYIDQDTGLWLLLLKTCDFKKMRSFLKSKFKPFVDSELRIYARTIKKNVWASTKQSIAYHLTWDVYNNEKSKYLSEKLSYGKSLWCHNRYCNAIYYSSNNGSISSNKINFKPFLRKIKTLPRLLLYKK